MLSSPGIRRISVAVFAAFSAAAAAVVVAGVVVSLQRLHAVLEAADAPQRALFDHGLSALDPRAPENLTNESCAVCHQDEYDQWKKSRHATAGVNENFQAQFLDPKGGRKQWCLNCHAPINPGGGLLPTQEPAGIDDAFREAPYWLTRGVGCITCHVRDGKILVTRVTKESSRHHPVRLAPELGKAEFCAGCHQFAEKFIGMPDAFGGRLQQASFAEFHDFHAAGAGVQRCHDCHMPAGDHLMPGGYSTSMVKSALELELSAKWQDDPQRLRVSVSVSAQGVGHRLPGGEHFFRFLTVRTWVNDADGRPVFSLIRNQPAGNGEQSKEKTVFKWPQIEEIGHQRGPFELGLDPYAKPTPDTRLSPGQERVYHYLTDIEAKQFKQPLQVYTEIWYHMMRQGEAVKFGFRPEKMERLILSKTTTIPPREDRGR